MTHSISSTSSHGCWIHVSLCSSSMIFNLGVKFQRRRLCSCCSKKQLCFWNLGLWISANFTSAVAFQSMGYKLYSALKLEALNWSYRGQELNQHCQAMTLKIQWMTFGIPSTSLGDYSLHRICFKSMSKTKNKKICKIGRKTNCLNFSLNICRLSTWLSEKLHRIRPRVK